MKARHLIRNIVLCLFILMPATFARADTTAPQLIFSEVKIRNDSTGYNEYVEIFNNSTDQISLNDYKIEYFNSTNPPIGQTPAGEAVVDTNILEAGDYFTLARVTSQITNSKLLPFSSLSDSGGRLKLVDNTGVVIDELAWTSTSSQAIAPVVLVTSTSSDKSIGRGYDANGLPISSGNWNLIAPNPQSSVLIPAPPDTPADTGEEPTAPPEETLPPDTPTETPDTATATNLLPLQVTELLPNPASPISDDEGEYVEIYNPNSEPIDLNGYKLQTGSNYTYSFTFTTQSIGPNSYLAFYSSETNLVLANSTGRARLLDPTGQTVSETNIYDDADEAAAWAFVNGSWQWTVTPTPNASNVLTLDTPVVKAAKAAAAKKATTAKKASTAKVASAKSTKAKAAANNRSGGSDDDEPNQISPVHPAVLAGVGGAALLYGAYEYRGDISNLVYKLKKYRRGR